MTVEATLQPISFYQFAISAPRQRTFITSARGVKLISVALVVVLHLAAFLAWMTLPPSEPVAPREMEVTIAMAIPPAVRPEVLPEPPPPIPVPQPRKITPAPEPVQRPVQAEVQPNVTPIEQPIAPAPAEAPVQAAAAPAPVAAPPVEAPPVVASPPPPPVLPDVEPDYKAAYLNNPEPSYPYAARRMGLQGTVVLNVEVLAEGLCGQINVHQSSGHKMLDNSALQTVKTWKFIPARQGGRAITKWFKIPYSFKFTDNEA